MTSVLIVDDSAAVRAALRQVLGAVRGLDLLEPAGDPLVAMQRMTARWPDVVVCDIEMPRLDGLAFLRQIMATRPTPFIIYSSLTVSGAAKTMEALAAGAVAVLAKPEAGGPTGGFQRHAAELVRAVRDAAAAKPRVVVSRPAGGAAARPVPRPKGTGLPVVALGASTGGTQALEVVLLGLTAHAPPMVIVQHMPPGFTAAFASRLDKLCQVAVVEARSGAAVVAGQALVAPGGKQMTVVRHGAGHVVQIADAPPVNRHCPSVDVLFRSVAKAYGPDAMGVLMTGMGDDGARGLLELRTAGAATYAQDEASSVVYGMPREAVRLGAAIAEVGLDEIAPLIRQWGGGARAAPSGASALTARRE